MLYNTKYKINCFKPKRGGNVDTLKIKHNFCGA